MQLATVLKKAKELGVPKENVEKALARVCSTEFQVSSLQFVLYS